MKCKKKDTQEAGGIYSSGFTVTTQGLLRPRTSATIQPDSEYTPGWIAPGYPCSQLHAGLGRSSSRERDLDLFQRFQRFLDQDQDNSERIDSGEESNYRSRSPSTDRRFDTSTEGAATESSEDPSWSAILLAVRCLVMEHLKPEHCPRPMGNPSPFGNLPFMPSMVGFQSRRQDRSLPHSPVARLVVDSLDGNLPAERKYFMQLPQALRCSTFSVHCPVLPVSPATIPSDQVQVLPRTPSMDQFLVAQEKLLGHLGSLLEHQNLLVASLKSMIEGIYEKDVLDRQHIRQCLHVLQVSQAYGLQSTAYDSALLANARLARRDLFLERSRFPKHLKSELRAMPIFKETLFASYSSHFTGTRTREQPEELSSSSVESEVPK